MQFNSRIYKVLIGEEEVSHKHYYTTDDKPYWVYEEGTLYQKQHLHGRGAIRKGLNMPSDTDCFYFPVGRIENGIHIGWSTQAANYSNQILKMSKHERSVYFPHLYFVQLGKNPYPSESRLSTSWLTQLWHRECHKILLPNEDMTQFFKTYNQFKMPI